MCVNNYDDKVERVPKMYGVPICPQCDPRTMTTRWDKEPVIRVRQKYRTTTAVAIARKLAHEGCLKKGKKKCRCLSCKAGKLFGVDRD